MTAAEKLALVKLMTDETDDNVVSAYIALAKQTIFEIAYPFGTFPEELPTRYDGVHVEIATYMINKRGAEGEIVHLENGLSRHWSKGDLPEGLVARITPFCSVL